VLDFAIIGLPRSGTAWASNWLTTDRTICLHDPLMSHTLDDLAAWDSGGKLVGVACTALWMFPDWVAANVKRVVCVDRDFEEVNQSLIDIGLTAMPQWSLERFQSLPGARVPMAGLFDPAQAEDIWVQLAPGVQFDAQRHGLLTGLSINPYFAGLEPDPRAVKDWVRRIQEAAQQ
jgi:hypothetical protein